MTFWIRFIGVVVGVLFLYHILAGTVVLIDLNSPEFFESFYTTTTTTTDTTTEPDHRSYSQSTLRIESESESESEYILDPAWVLPQDPWADLEPFNISLVNDLWDSFHRERLEDNSIHHRREAYVFYVTSIQYACGAAVIMQQLRELGSTKEFLVIHLASLDAVAMRLLRTSGAETRIVDPIPLVVPGGGAAHYRDVLVKLRIFQQTDYDRLLFMDADVTVLHNVDHLFGTILRGNEEIAATTNAMVTPHRFSPWFMIIEPSERLWSEIEQKFLHKDWDKMFVGGHHAYDGDILNVVFAGDRSLKFPPQYAFLNTEWCRGNNWYHSLTKVGASPMPAGAVHFSCWMKPWHHNERELDSLKTMDPILIDIYRDWYARARSLDCPIHT